MASRFCSHCGSAVSPGAAFCANCGTTLAPMQSASPVALSPAPQTTASAPAHAASPSTPRLTPGMALAGLLLNILVWPGLGSLVAGRKVGWAQGFLFLGGVVLAIVLIGIPILIGAWIWGLVTGIQLVQESNAPANAAGA